MSVFQVENQWGGTSEPWHQGNTWIIGGRKDQAVVAVDIKSKDNGRTFTGTMTYKGEGKISLKAEHKYANVYDVKVQWGGSSEPWHEDGSWIIGGRNNQRCIQLNVTASNDNNLSGDMTYEGEGPIGFKAEQISGNKYNTQNQWGGNDAPWHEGGTWVIGQRVDQRVVSLKVHSDDKGQTLVGNNTYDGEGPVGFIGVLVLVGAASQKTNQVAYHA